MIGITQWRAAIGIWHGVCYGSSSAFGFKTRISLVCMGKFLMFLFLIALSSDVKPNIVLILMLLSLCGDVHPNPGPPQTQQPLGICHINARSLTAPNRLDLIEQDLILDKAFDIVGLTETHLDESVSHIAVNSFQLFRNDRNRHGGGVALLINDNLPCKRRTDFEVDGLELLWVETIFRNKSLLCGVCYRPPGMSQDQVAEFISQLRFSFELISNLNDTSCLVLLGDFNDRCSNWESDHADSELGTQLVDLLADFDYSQLIDESTRNQNILDLIITD